MGKSGALSEFEQRNQQFAIVFVAIGALVALAIGILMYIQMRPPRVTLREGRLVIANAVYSREIAMADIRSISLEQALPAIVRRNNGFSLAGTFRGYFRLENLGDGMLFIESKSPPFILVRTWDRDFVAVNFNDPALTREVYEELRRNRSDEILVPPNMLLELLPAGDVRPFRRSWNG